MQKLDTSFGIVEEVCVMLNHTDISHFFDVALPHALPTLVVEQNERVIKEISKRTKRSVCRKRE